MASFNFDKFDTEFEMKQMLRNATEALDALRKPANANERLVPLEPGMPLQRPSQTCRTKEKPATKDERCSKILQNQPKPILRKKKTRPLHHPEMPPYRFHCERQKDFGEAGFLLESLICKQQQMLCKQQQILYLNHKIKP